MSRSLTTKNSNRTVANGDETDETTGDGLGITTNIGSMEDAGAGDVAVNNLTTRSNRWRIRSCLQLFDVVF